MPHHIHAAMKVLQRHLDFVKDGRLVLAGWLFRLGGIETTTHTNTVPLLGM